MVYCDKNDAVIQWQSEEIAIPYKSPVDGKWHRYYPDFMIKYRDATGKIRKVMVEVKIHLNSVNNQKSIHPRKQKLG